MSKQELVIKMDIGGSELRTSISEDTILRYPPAYKVIGNVPIVQGSKTEDIIDLSAKLGNGEMVEPMRLAIGASMNLYSQKATRSYNDKSKSLAEETIINIMIAIYRLSEAMKIKAEDNKILINKLQLLIPVLEINTKSGQDLKTKLTNLQFGISKPKTLERIKFKIEEVELHPEGISGLETLDYKINTINKYILLFESGERTSNAALIRDKNIIEGAVDTFKICGQTLKSKVKSNLRRDFDLDINEDDTIEILTTGMYHKEKDVKNALNEAKQSFMDEVYPLLLEFLNSRNINLSTIDMVIASGRTYNDSNIDGKFLELFKEKFPSKEVIILDDGLANIKGLFRRNTATTGETIDIADDFSFDD